MSDTKSKIHSSSFSSRMCLTAGMSKSRQEGSLSVTLASGGGGSFLWILNRVVQILLVTLLKHVTGVWPLPSPPAELTELHSSMSSSVSAADVEPIRGPVPPTKIGPDPLRPGVTRRVDGVQLDHIVS